MRGLWIAVWLGLSGAAVADPYCKPDAAELAALPGLLAGDWQRSMVSGTAVVGGVPQQMPQDGSSTPATLLAEGGGLGMPDPSLAESAHFIPDSGPSVDFALPGESPLMAAELLAPLLAEAGIACDAADLPQFQARLAAGQGLGMRLQLFVLRQDRLVLVTSVAQLGPVARPGTAVRVMMRLGR